MKLLKIFLLACMVMVTGIYAAEGSQSNILWHNSTTGAVKFMPINNMIHGDTLNVVDSSNLNLIPRGIADFTGDNEPDILFHNQNSGNLRIWKMDGAVKVDNILVLGSSNTNLMIAGVGDFDQDGDNDIATFNTNSGALRMWVMDGAVRVDNVLVLTGANTNLVPRGAGDMDGDGVPDLVLRNNNSGAVRIWTMNSDFTRKGNEYIRSSSNTNLELRGVVDINDDGNNDILNYNTSTGVLRAWLMDGNLKIIENAEIVQESDLAWSVRGGSTVTTTISGTATLPSYTPAGRLWLVVSGPDGNIYGAGPSDTDGYFSIESSIPTETKGVVVYAVDPDDPEHYAMAYVSVDSNSDLQTVQRSSNNTAVSVDAESTAKVLVLMASDEFTSKEQTLQDQLTDGFLLDPPSLCSVGRGPIDDVLPDIKLTDLIKEQRSPIVRNHVDSYVQQSATLISRVRSAMEDARDNIISANQPSNWTGTGMDSYIGLQLALLRTRNILANFHLPSDDVSVREGWVSRSDLEGAAAVIYNLDQGNFMLHGYGNCSEKGLAGAYIASRFPEFRQIAQVAIFRPSKINPFKDVPHAFAIACQESEDESGFDLHRLVDRYDKTVPFPDGLYSANCMVIDPWDGFVETITRELVTELQWHAVEQIMKVESAQSSSNAASLTEHQTYAILSESLPLGDCPTNSELTSAVCTPFSIPVDNIEPDVRKWVRVGAAMINPANAQTEFYGGGSDPYWFAEPRFEGKWRIFYVRGTSIAMYDREVDHGYEYYNVNITSTFNAPPVELIPGKTYALDANFSHGGNFNEGNPGAQFEYRADKNKQYAINPFAEPLGYYPWSQYYTGVNTKTWTLTAPQIYDYNVGDEFNISAFWWNCAACNVTWTYEAK